MSSRIQDPTETPPHDIPCTRLPASDSLRGRPSAFLFGLFIEMGLAPAKESCRPLPILESNAVPLMMADVCESVSWNFTCWPWADGDDEFRVGVAISMGEVDGIVNRWVESLSSGVGGCSEDQVLEGESVVSKSSLR